MGLVPSLVGLLRRFRSFVAYVCGTTRFADHCGSSETHNHDSDAQRARQIKPLSIAFPSFAKTLEVIFVEGHSSDGEIERVARANPQSASDLPDGTPGYAVSQPRRQ